MSEQVPDRWVFLNTKIHEHEFQMILSGWYGGYLGSNEFRRSTPIASIEEHAEKLIVLTDSGTKYILYKNRKGLTAFMQNVYNNMLEQAKYTNVEISIEANSEV